MHRIRIGLKFEKTLYHGDLKDSTLSGSLNSSAVEFIIKHSKKPHVLLYIVSDKHFALFSVLKMKKWFKEALRKWLLGTTINITRLESIGIHIVPDMELDNQVLIGLVDSWINRITNNIHWSVFKTSSIDIMIEEPSMLTSRLWDTPYLDIYI